MCINKFLSENNDNIVINYYISGSIMGLLNHIDIIKLCKDNRLIVKNFYSPSDMFSSRLDGNVSNTIINHNGIIKKYLGFGTHKYYYNDPKSEIYTDIRNLIVSKNSKLSNEIYPRLIINLGYI